jgi:hypothetical protein
VSVRIVLFSFSFYILFSALLLACFLPSTLTHTNTHSFFFSSFPACKYSTYLSLPFIQGSNSSNLRTLPQSPLPLLPSLRSSIPICYSSSSPPFCLYFFFSCSSLLTSLLILFYSLFYSYSLLILLSLTGKPQTETHAPLSSHLTLPPPPASYIDCNFFIISSPTVEKYFRYVK